MAVGKCTTCDEDCSVDHAEELAELKAMFKLFYSAQQRAIQMWQEKTGERLKWPDSANLMVWLMEENADLRLEVEVRESEIRECEREIARLEDQVEELRDRNCP